MEGQRREGIVVRGHLHRKIVTSRNRTGRFHVLRCLFALLRMVVVNRCSELGKVEGDQSLHA